MAAKSIPQLRQLMTMDIDSLSCLSGVREVAPELLESLKWTFNMTLLM